MHNAYFSGDIDVTVIVLTSFVLFFIGLIIYLRREDRREGYPLEDEVSGRLEPAGGLFFTAKPKTFILPHGAGTLTKPNAVRESQEIAATRTSRAPGSPLEPIGDPLLAGVGPGAFAKRAKKPDMLMHHGIKIAPLRAAEGFSIDPKDPDPRGMAIVGADGVKAGVISDVWIDRGEYMIRYLEVTLAGGGKQVLVPMPLAVVQRSKGTVRVDAVLGSQFAKAPTLENPNQITFDEEERVAAFFGGGLLYATAARAEPWL
jgi:photosynthetic reaction center H subunit